MTARDVCDSRLRASFCPEGALAKPAEKIAVCPRDRYISGAGREGETAGTESPGSTEGFQVNKLVPWV